MAKFINVRTGNTLTVKDDAVISLMEKSENYTAVLDNPTTAPAPVPDTDPVSEIPDPAPAPANKKSSKKNE